MYFIIFGQWTFTFIFKRVILWLYSIPAEKKKSEFVDYSIKNVSLILKDFFVYENLDM